MRKFFLGLSLAVMVISTFASCSATKRDCQGVKHTKQKGGFYL